uniref:Uncharacterized protein n=1 Tax=Monodon monoceros TaxID=40151 RepID=A0A8C6AIZ5_MONMO
LASAPPWGRCSYQSWSEVPSCSLCAHEARSGLCPLPLCTQHHARGQTHRRGWRGCHLGGGRETDQRRKHEPEPSLLTFILDQDGDPDTPKPVSFTMKETVCPRTSQEPQENCDFKENGLVKQCVGTVTLDQVKGQMNITCDEVSGPF